MLLGFQMFWNSGILKVQLKEIIFFYGKQQQQNKKTKLEFKVYLEKIIFLPESEYFLCQ